MGTAAHDRGPPCHTDHSSTGTTRPAIERRLARAAAAPYRRVYGEPPVSIHRGCAHETTNAAIAAFKEVVPEISDREAMLEAVAAVHYARVVAPKWLYALYQPAPRQRE